MDFGILRKTIQTHSAFSNWFENPKLPISKPNTRSCHRKGDVAWARAGSREFRLWRHTKSRLTLHGKLAKAKPWNCTTRFSHFVHDTISFSTAENRDSGAHVCKAPVWLGCLVDMPVCVEENSLMEIEDFHCALHSFSFFFFKGKRGKTKLIWSISIQYSM